MNKIAATDISMLDDNGQAVVLKAGKPVPAWAAKRINNASALVDGDDAAASSEQDQGDDADASSPTAGSQLEQVDDPELTGENVVPVDYSGLTVKELREELEKRELDSDGKKVELVARLEASDAASPEQGGDEDE